MIPISSLGVRRAAAELSLCASGSRRAKVIRAEGCWGWSAAHFIQNGYALLTIKGADGVWRPTTAHRVSYEAIHRPDSSGDLSLTTCAGILTDVSTPRTWKRSPRAENVRRGNHPTAVLVREGVCSRGHRLSGDNVIVRKSGKRECRTCVRDT